ncbi:MAG: phage/plasmid primase, P4 family [Deltaproteobacteria bacterium]|nr:phage/plasmid primase, P4 family [Deltaproteobacteria bacterium]
MQICPLFFAIGEVVEILAIGVSGKNPGWEGFSKGTISGYYNDPGAFDKGAGVLEAAEARGVYFTINPVNPALIARASNRLKAAKATTQDVDIVCIRWLPIDLDTKRPADISATEAEVQAAVDLGKKVAAWLEGELGFAKGIRAGSGNGCHLLYRLPDLPNNTETHQLVVDMIAAVAAKFKNDLVDVDVTTVNPARIWKLYGTTGRKGDSTADRPHRKSYLFPKQPKALDDVPVTDPETLKKLAALAKPAPRKTGGVRPGADATIAQGAAPPTPVPPAAGATRFKEGTLGPIKVDAYLTHYGISYTAKEKGDRTLYILDHCLFNPDHDNGQASIIAAATGPVIYQCFHASCKGKLWKDARAKISGDKSIAEFCAGYDPNWKPPTQTGTGAMAALSVTSEMVVQSDALVKPPVEIDPNEFFEKRGKRPVFVPMFLAKYLATYLNPLLHTSGGLWRYNGKGIWKPFTDTSMAAIMAAVMKERVQADMMTNTLKILRAIINREEDMWPIDTDMINVANGMLDIRTMELIPHDPKHGSRTQLPVNYNPKAFSQRWHDFLKEIFPDDDKYAKRGLLQQYFGYCLLRDCRYQKALFLYGTGANGKSTVLDVLQAVVGRENTSSLSLADLTQRFKAQFLRDKLINLATETNTRDPLATELLKAIIVGDSITAEQKYGEQFQFRPFAKFITAMNDAPVIPDKSYGFGRRIIVLTFERRFTDEEINPRMAQYLIEEIDGVFNWMVEGLKVLLKNDGFKISEDVGKDTSDFMETLNPLLIFVNEMCEVHEGVSVPTTDLWECYAEWCTAGHNRPLGRNRFLDQVRQTFPKVTRTKKQEGSGEDQHRTMSFVGIGLTNQAREWLADRKARFAGRSRREE